MYSEMYSSRKSQCLVQLLSSYSVQFAKKAACSKILLRITVIVSEVWNCCGKAEISNQTIFMVHVSQIKGAVLFLIN